jgi:hypothetical protein
VYVVDAPVGVDEAKGEESAFFAERKRASCSLAITSTPCGPACDKAFSVVFEVRQDEEGEILHLVTLWRSTREEVRMYEENS